MANGVDEPPGKKAMTVGELIAWLDELDDDDFVYMEASDGQLYGVTDVVPGEHEHEARLELKLARVPEEGKRQETEEERSWA